MSATTIETRRPGLDELDRHVHERRWVILGVLCVSLLIIVIDNTILNVAIPSLIRDLDASNSQIQWIIDSYVIVFAGLLLTTASCRPLRAKGRPPSRSRAVRAGSIASASVDTANQLIFTRAFMGIGGLLIMPSTLSILTKFAPTFFVPQGNAGGRSRATPGPASPGVAVALGPMTGGFLLEHFSWQSVFWGQRSRRRRRTDPRRVHHPSPTHGSADSTRSAPCSRSPVSPPCCSASSRARPRAGRRPKSSSRSLSPPSRSPHSCSGSATPTRRCST